MTIYGHTGFAHNAAIFGIIPMIFYTLSQETSSYIVATARPGEHLNTWSQFFLAILNFCSQNGRGSTESPRKFGNGP